MHKAFNESEQKFHQKFKKKHDTFYLGEIILNHMKLKFNLPSKCLLQKKNCYSLLNEVSLHLSSQFRSGDSNCAKPKLVSSFLGLDAQFSQVNSSGPEVL